jgi:3-dehydroquinate dehydratase-2
MKFLVLNGPNLNMLGIREPDIYGSKTFSALESFVRDICDAEGIEVTLFQSNYEGALVEKIQEAYGVYDGIVINPAAYTHTSVAILDALKSVAIPTVEVHLSKVEEREPFRQISYVSYVAKRTITGLGFDGYRDAILFLKQYLSDSSKQA